MILPREHDVHYMPRRESRRDLYIEVPVAMDNEQAGQEAQSHKQSRRDDAGSLWGKSWGCLPSFAEMKMPSSVRFPKYAPSKVGSRRLTLSSALALVDPQSSDESSRLYLSSYGFPGDRNTSGSFGFCTGKSLSPEEDNP